MEGMETVVGRGGRVFFKRACGYCKKEILRDAWHLRTINYCSFSCRNKGSHIGRPISDSVKERIRKTLTGRKWTDEQRAKVVGRVREKSPRYKTDSANKNTGHHRARRYFPATACERCGTAPGEGPRIERHHIDRDPLNNSPSNIEILCQKCHSRLHAEARKARKKNEYQGAN